jgi:branched-chain amino acid transport system ATP-binding protein
VPDVLRARAIESGYGRVQVLWGVDLDVRERETVVLLGANGAGKTTFLKTVLGLLPAWRGSLDLAGEDVTALRTDKRVRRGIVYMSETCGFAGLTVEENLLIGGHFLARREARARADAAYALFPALATRRRALAASLSGGERKMLGIGKVYVASPRIAVLDEPSAGLSPRFVKEVIRVLAQLRTSGLSLLVAEQNVKFLDLADRVYTLDGGRVRFTGTVAEMRENDAVRKAYFGLK